MLFLLVLVSANAACETQVLCHQIKAITVKKSKLTIKFYKSVVDLQEFVLIKVLFKTIYGRFISKLWFLVKYDMINSCKIFYIRYRIRDTKHPWVHEQEFKVLEKSTCTTCIKSFVNLLRIFLRGGIPSLSWNFPWGVFLTKKVDWWHHQILFADVRKNSFWSVKYKRVTWHGWWGH